MPILHIRALSQSDSDRIVEAIKQTTKAIAEAYGCPQQHVWVTWEEIKPGLYFEGDTPATLQPPETHPPIAQLICFEGKSPEQIENVLLAAANSLSRGLGIPDNIFISYQEVKSGELVAGDGVVKRGQ